MERANSDVIDGWSKYYILLNCTCDQGENTRVIYSVWWKDDMTLSECMSDALNSNLHDAEGSGMCANDDDLKKTVQPTVWCVDL